MNSRSSSFSVRSLHIRSSRCQIRGALDSWTDWSPWGRQAGLHIASFQRLGLYPWLGQCSFAGGAAASRVRPAVTCYTHFGPAGRVDKRTRWSKRGNWTLVTLLYLFFFACLLFIVHPVAQMLSPHHRVEEKERVGVAVGHPFCMDQEPVYPHLLWCQLWLALVVSQAHLYSQIEAAGITYVSIGHRKTLHKFHNKALYISKSDSTDTNPRNWELKPADKLPAEEPSQFPSW
jgi:hypothetical protein